MLTDIRNQIDTIKREVGLPIIERLNIPEDTTSEEEKEMTRKSVEKLAVNGTQNGWMRKIIMMMKWFIVLRAKRA